MSEFVAVDAGNKCIEQVVIIFSAEGIIQRRREFVWTVIDVVVQEGKPVSREMPIM